MLRITKAQFFWGLVIAFVNIALPMLVFATFTGDSFNVYFSSDTMYLSGLYDDLFVNGTGFKGWNLNGAPNFFPDMLLYFIIRPFFSDFKIAYIVFSIVQYNLIALLTAQLFKSLNTRIPDIYRLMFLLIFPVFLLASIWNHSFNFTFHLFSQSYHNGCFINVLASFNLLFLYLNQRRKHWLWLLGIFAFLGTYNDRLYLVIFSLPVGFIWAINFFRFKMPALKKAGFLVLLLSVIALVTYQYTSINPIFRCIGLGGKYMNLSNIKLSFDVFTEQHINYTTHLNWRAVPLWLTFVSTLALLGWLVFKAIKTKFFKDADKSQPLEILFVLAVVTSIVVALFTPVINGYYVGYACFRYITIGYFLGVFNFVLAWYLIFPNKANAIKYAVIGGMLALYLTTMAYKVATEPLADNFKKVRHYYPEQIKNLDNFLAKHNLQYGVATYWDSKFATQLSKNGARVYTVIDNNLNVWFHLMNSNWYYPYHKGKYNNPKFNFVILDTDDFAQTRQIFGEPIDSALLAGKKYVYYLNEFRYDKATRKPYPVVEPSEMRTQATP